jgi:hypothetical protein
MLEKEHLRRAGFVGKPLLGSLAFLAAEGRIGEHDVELGGRILIEPGVGRIIGKGS